MKKFFIMKHEEIILSGKCWNDIKNYPVIVKCKIESTYQSISDISSFIFKVKGNMDLTDSNNIILNGRIEIGCDFKFSYMMDEDEEIDDHTTHQLTIEINYSDNKLNGEYNIMCKELNDGKDLYLKYIHYINDNKVTDIDFFCNNLYITYYDMGIIYKAYIYFYKEEFSDEIFNIYPEIKFDSRWSEKIKFVNKLLENYYPNDFKKGETYVYLTDVEFSNHARGKTADQLFEMFNDKLLTLKSSTFSFKFLFCEENHLYTISIVHSPYFHSKTSVELVIHDDENVELYALRFHENSDTPFSKAIDDIHKLASLLGYKEIYLFDYAHKYIKNDKIPISLIRKLAGRSYFYEKYGYQLKDDVRDIEKKFEIFCGRNVNENMNKTIREYFQLVDSDRCGNLYNTLPGMLNYLLTMKDNKAFLDMVHMISDVPFFKKL